jgi:phosphoglycolate phosphatase
VPPPASRAGGASISAKFHVGDTPNDIQAAIKVGAVPVGVATGIYSSEQLKEFCTVPESVLLEGLHDVEGMLRVLGL